MTAPGSPNWLRKSARGSVDAAGLLSDDLSSSAVAWAAPSARDWKSGDASTETMARNARPLNEQVEHWPTPTAADHGKASLCYSRGNPTLIGAAEMWPTPTAGRKGPGGEGKREGGPTLQTVALSLPDPETKTDGARSSPSARTSRRRLNPNFVDWLMGWPPGWSGCAPLVTASCRNARR